jgi:hypothetical protein
VGCHREHTILDTVGAAAEFYDDWTDGAETVVGGAGGPHPATPDRRITVGRAAVAETAAGSLVQLGGGRTVMSAAGFCGASKAWENCNSRGDRVACYELQMLPRLRSGMMQFYGIKEFIENAIHVYAP